MSMELELSKLKMALICDKKYVFFISILFSLELLINDKISTARTDGESIELSPDFWAKLKPAEKIFLLLHEVMHVALGHPARLGDRNPRKFNAACDYAINYDLVEAGYTMPEEGLYDPQYGNMTAEAIYDLLPDSDDYDEEDIIFSDKEGLKEKLEEMLIRAGASAALANSDPGCTPSSAERMLDKLLNPLLPWEVILQNLMLEHSTNDYSMQFPDEEYMPNLYVPTLYSEGMGAINFYTDVSGSVSQRDISVTLSEVNAMRELLKPTVLRLISFDTQIHLETEYTEHETVDIGGIDLRGGGGTEVNEIYKHIENTQPEIAVIVTDGYYSEIPLKTEANVIYLILDNANFNTNNGRVIHVETEKYE